MNKLKKPADIDKPDTAPYYPSAEELRKAAKCVYVITEEDVARDLALWMIGCGYPFHAYEYFCRKARELSISKGDYSNA